MDYLKKYLHVLIIPFAFFTVWLWSFPMYGPLLANIDNNPYNLFMFFLVSHALGLLVYGYVMDLLEKRQRENKLELYITFIISVIISLLTIIFPFLTSNPMRAAIIITGFFSGFLVVYFLYNMSISKTADVRGGILGFIFFLAGIFFIVFLVVPYGIWMYFVNALFLLAPFILVKIGIKKKQNISSVEIGEKSNTYWFSLILLVILFYSGSGLMYNLLYGRIMTVEGGFFDIGFLFYPLVVLPAGILADRFGRKILINIGLSFSGLGFLLLLFRVFSTLSLILLQSAFAVMDIFLFLTLMDWSDYFNNRKVLSIGLFINVIVIYISGMPFLISNLPTYISPEFWPAVGLVMVLLIIPLLYFVKETYLIKQSKDILPNKQTKQMEFDELCSIYSISPREKEIIGLLLEGKSTKVISDLLSISYNTLKTHLRNIYRKTKTKSQNELIVLFWEKVEKK